MDGASRGVTALTTTNICYIAQTGSTNADLAAQVVAHTPPPEGHWLVTDRQSAGRGRLGRAWQDGLGNFMGSTIVHVGPLDPPAHSLAMVMAVALHDAIVAAMDRAGQGANADGRGHATLSLKWPNDVLMSGAKLAGILAERVHDHVIIGVGANLSSAPEIPGRATTSLAAAGYRVARDDFAALLAQRFAVALARWRGGGWPQQILSDWGVRAHPVGTTLSISEGHYAGLTGVFDGLEQDGGLRLRTADGRMIIIHAGEVQLPGAGE